MQNPFKQRWHFWHQLWQLTFPQITALLMDLLTWAALTHDRIPQTLRTSPLDVTVYCQLQSNPAAAGGNRAVLQVMARICHQTSAVHGPGGWHCQVLSGGEICLSGLEGTGVWEQLRGRQGYSLVCVSETQLTFLVMLLGEPRWDTDREGHGTGLCSSESLGAGVWLGECQSTGCVLRALAWGMTLPCAPSRARS